MNHDEEKDVITISGYQYLDEWEHEMLIKRGILKISKEIQSNKDKDGEEDGQR